MPTNNNRFKRSILHQKRGGTFWWRGTLTHKQYTDFTGWSCAVKVKGMTTTSFTDDVTFLWEDEAGGQFLIKKETENWPIETLRLEFEYRTATGEIVPSPDLHIVVSEEVIR